MNASNMFSMPVHQLLCILQVYEETGFDIRARLVETDYIEVHVGEQRCRLYIIQGVRLPAAERCGVQYSVIKGFMGVIQKDDIWCCINRVLQCFCCVCTALQSTSGMLLLRTRSYVVYLCLVINFLQVSQARTVCSILCKCHQPCKGGSVLCTRSGLQPCMHSH